MQKQRKTHAKLKKTQNPQDWQSFSETRNLERASMREAYNSFQNETLSRNLVDNPKKFWSYVKYTSGKTQTVSSLRDSNGNATNDSTAKAELLNTVFRNSFTKEDEVNTPEFESRTAASMQNLEVEVPGVVKQLKSLNKNKSLGPDCIPVRFLSEYADAIGPYLAIIYNKSLNDRCVPKDWKVAQVTPIFKKGNRSDPQNYRPISLT